MLTPSHHVGGVQIYLKRWMERFTMHMGLRSWFLICWALCYLLFPLLLRWLSDKYGGNVILSCGMGHHKTAAEAVYESTMFLSEWRQSQSPAATETMPANQCQAWLPPSIGSWKLNVDATFFKETQQTGIGMAIRDENGAFVMGRTKIFTGCFDVDVGEALGFYEAFSWLKELELNCVMVEGDSKIVVDDINYKCLYNSIFGDYVYVCRSILLSGPEFTVVFAKKSVNAIVYEFARVSQFYGDSNVWDDSSDFVVVLHVHTCSCNNGR
ncbi:hypothetical protein ACS0TY_029440 [Phlomoides rotata]